MSFLFGRLILIVPQTPSKIHEIADEFLTYFESNFLLAFNTVTITLHEKHMIVKFDAMKEFVLATLKLGEDIDRVIR